MSKNISMHKSTLTYHLNDILPKIGKMDREELETTVREILNDPDVSISPASKKKYEIGISKNRSTVALQKYIYDIALKGSGMGV